MAQKLYRETENKVFFGVCAGLAQYLNVDPVIIRLIFIAVFFAGGSGFLVYIICAIAIPKRPYFPNQQSNFEDFEDGIRRQEPSNKNYKSVVLGGMLIIIGAFLLVDKFIPNMQFENYYPILMIVVGAFLLFNSFVNTNVETEWQILFLSLNLKA